MTAGAKAFSGSTKPQSAHEHAIGWLLAVFVAAVWLINGLVVKVLLLLPRHLQIVQAMPGLSGVRGIAAMRTIGVGEILLAGWVISGVRMRACAMFQIVVVLAMNCLELTFARNHLLTPIGLVPINLIFLTMALCAAELRSDEAFYWLRRHPFPVEAIFGDSLVVTYALPAETLRRALPPGLTLDEYGGFGILAVAMVQTRALRPSGLPAWLGQDFLLIGYRIFTRHFDGQRTRRGLFILRSDANKLRMVLLGNLLTHYRYRRCSGTLQRKSNRLNVFIQSDDGHGEVDVLGDLDAKGSLPATSIFKSTQDARRYAGPLPYTFDYEATTQSIVMIEGVRADWTPELVGVEVRSLSFLDQPCFDGEQAILCSAFWVHDIPYHWKRGVRVPLKPGR